MKNRVKSAVFTWEFGIFHEKMPKNLQEIQNISNSTILFQKTLCAMIELKVWSHISDVTLTIHVILFKVVPTGLASRHIVTCNFYYTAYMIMSKHLLPFS